MNEFDRWNQQKKNLDSKQTNIYFKQGDIWWLSLGRNIGSESYGKGENFRRPVLIIRKLSSTLFLGIPLSTKTKEGSWFEQITIHGIKQTALLYQIRIFDIRRFQRKLAELDEQDLKLVKTSLGKLISS